MPTKPPAPVLDRSRDAVLLAATRLLLESPQLSLAELSGRIGIGRTTLHRMFATRTDLLTEITDDALNHLGRVYADVGLVDADVGLVDADVGLVDADVGLVDADVATAPGGEAHNVLLLPVRRLIDRLVPLGPQLMFLLRATELQHDPEVGERSVALDEPLLRYLERAQRGGALDPALPARWVMDCLYSMVYTGWEHVQAGHVAARDAGPLIVRSWLRGAATPQ